MHRRTTLADSTLPAADTHAFSRVEQAQTDAGPENAVEAHAPAVSREADVVLRCSNTADVLAALPHLTGYTTSNSLCIVLFRGNRATDTLRIDLPGDESRAAVQPYVDSVMELLRDTTSAGVHPALIITTTKRFNTRGDTPWSSLAEQLLHRLQAEHLEPRECAVVAANGWTSMLGRGAGQRHSLEEIARSSIQAHTHVLQSEPTDFAGLGVLPQADPQRTERVATHLRELQRTRSWPKDCTDSTHRSAQSSGVWMQGIARVAGVCFASDPADQMMPREIDDRLLARLIVAAQHPDHWLVLVLTALTRAEFMVGVADSEDAQRFTNVPVGIDFTHQQPRGWSIGQLLLALSQDSPHAAKLRQALGVMSEAAAHAPTALQPGLLAFLSWGWWMLGMQTVARRLINDSLAIDPGHELTQMVRTLNEAQPQCNLQRLRAQVQL